MIDIDKKYLEVINEWGISEDEENVKIDILYEDEYGTKGFIIGKYDEEYKYIQIQILRIFPLGNPDNLNISVDLDVKYRLLEIIKNGLTEKYLMRTVKEYMEITAQTYNVGARIGNK